MEIHVITIDGAPDLKFSGECLSHVKSDLNDGGYEVDFSVYVTENRNYICHRIEQQSLLSDSDNSSGCVYEDLEQIKIFFGHGKLAKKLYSDIGIDDICEIH